jgi:hypothetical protein
MHPSGEDDVQQDQECRLSKIHVGLMGLVYEMTPRRQA